MEVKILILTGISHKVGHSVSSRKKL